MRASVALFTLSEAAGVAAFAKSSDFHRSCGAAQGRTMIFDLIRIDTDGLHFDLAQFGAIKDIAEKIIAAQSAGDSDGVWREFGLLGEEDVDDSGGDILTALAALELMYAPKLPDASADATGVDRCRPFSPVNTARIRPRER